MNTKLFFKSFLLIFLSCFCLAQESSSDASNTFETQEIDSDFQEWKAKKEESWKQVPDVGKQNVLLSAVLRKLEILEKKLADADAQKEALYSYNFLRDLRNLPKAKSFSELDRDWVKAITCFIYNASRESEINNSPFIKTDSEKKLYLLAYVNRTYWKDIARIDTATQASSLCTYNYLRSLYGQVPAMSFNEIDYDWLTEIEVKVLEGFAQEVNAEYKQLMQEPKPEPEKIESEKSELEDKLSFLMSLKGLPEDFKQQALSLVNNLLESISHYTTLLQRKVLSLWDAYKVWKEEKTEKWDKESLPEAQRRYNLLVTINLAMGDEQLHEIALFAYNFLREKLALPLAQDFSQLDKKWLQEEEYSLWKDYFDSVLEKFNKSRLELLLINLGTWLRDWENHPDNETLKKHILYGYNYVREIKNQPLIRSLDKLDSKWLKDVIHKQALTNLNFEEPTFAQAELLREATAIIDLKDELVLGSTSHPIQSTSQALVPILPALSLVALCTDLDLDWRLFTAYHELGHIINEKSYVELENAKDYDQIMSQPQFENDIKRVDYYLELGKKAFDTSSQFGKRMSLIAPLFNTFWIPAQDELLNKEILYRRNKEKRADFFALEELYKQNKIDTILSLINYWGSRGGHTSKFAFIVNSKETSEIIHPSDLERALYTAGFLVDKVVDINKAFREWENSRQCIDAERAYEKKRQAQTKTFYAQGKQALREALKQQPKINS